MRSAPDLRRCWSRPCSPAELMLFGFQLHTCKLTRQLRTAYWLLVQSLDSRPVWTSSLSRLGNTMWEKVCVSQSTCGCPMHIYPYTVHMLQGKHASMHRVLPGACCWSNWYGVISRFRLLWCMLQLQQEDRMRCIYVRLYQQPSPLAHGLLHRCPRLTRLPSGAVCSAG